MSAFPCASTKWPNKVPVHSSGKKETRMGKIEWAKQSRERMRKLASGERRREGERGERGERGREGTTMLQQRCSVTNHRATARITV